MEPNHVRDLMEVYSSIYAEYGDKNIIQERAWWDPAGVFMSKRDKEVEKAKSTPTGGGGASYNPNTGRTYNPNARDQSRATGVIAPRGGVMGTMEPGKPSTWQRYAPGSDPYRRQNIDRYTTVRGRDQIRQDDTRNQAAKDKARRDAAATADFDRRYGVDKPPGDEFAAARKNTRVVSQPATKPVAKPAAKPAPTPTAKPAPTPTAKPTPTPTATPSTPTTTSSSPSSQLTDLRKMRIASQMRQSGANVVSTQLASFDPFDTIMGYLLDEGYADTKKSAIAIMANMSEEWKQNILGSK